MVRNHHLYCTAKKILANLSIVFVAEQHNEKSFDCPGQVFASKKIKPISRLDFPDLISIGGIILIRD